MSGFIGLILGVLITNFAYHNRLKVSERARGFTEGWTSAMSYRHEDLVGEALGRVCIQHCCRACFDQEQVCLLTRCDLEVVSCTCQDPE